MLGGSVSRETNCTNFSIYKAPSYWELLGTRTLPRFSCLLMSTGWSLASGRSLSYASRLRARLFFIDGNVSHSISTYIVNLSAYRLLRLEYGTAPSFSVTLLGKSHVVLCVNVREGVRRKQRAM